MYLITLQFLLIKNFQEYWILEDFSKSNSLNISMKTDYNCLNSADARRLNGVKLKARRPVKLSKLVPRYKRWLATWPPEHKHPLLSAHSLFWRGKVHIDERQRVRRRGTAYEQRNIVGSTAFGGVSVIFWACFSNDCKYAVHVVTVSWQV